MSKSSERSVPAAGVTVHIEQCKGCGRCVAFCPKGVLDFSDKTNHLGFHFAQVAHREKCIQCGMCFYACPEPGAISVNREKPKS